MFNTFFIRVALAVAWGLLVVSLWWGYGRLAGRYPVAEALERLDRAVAAGDWVAAAEADREVQQQWDRVRTIVELNQGGTALEAFERDLSQLHGAVAARDAGLARMQIAGLQRQWQGLRSPFPDGG